jgi:Bacterial transcriptional repressor
MCQRLDQVLLRSLYTELQMHVKANQLRDLGDLRQIPHLEDLLARGFHLMWEYRFLFRDHINWAVAQREVREQLVALTIQGHAFIERVLERLCQLDLLQIQKSEIAMLATNIWIISRYWIDYCQLRSEQQQITEQNIQEGIQQLRALVFPYFTPQGRQMLNRQERHA